MNINMKIYIFYTPQFEAINVAIASNLEEAKRYTAEYKADNLGIQRSNYLADMNRDIENGDMIVIQKTIGSGFIVTGGGNG